MSYISELKKGALSPAGFVKRSAGWLARLAGFTDSKVDELVQKADAWTDEAEDEAAALFSAFIGRTFPAVPKQLRDVLALRGAQIGLQAIDAGLAGFGEELKKFAPDD